MDYTDLLSDNPVKVAAAIGQAITTDRASAIKHKARTGQRYYEFKHDILKNRIFYVNDEGNLVEDKYASNIRIPHSFFTEQVDQKGQYLLSNPVEVTVEDDENFQQLLNEYYDEDMQVFFQEIVEGASVKGFDYAFARTKSDDRLHFQVADMLHAFPIYDDSNDVVAFVRYYDKKISKNGQKVTVTIGELWDDKQVTYYSKTDNRPMKLDLHRKPNPRPHVMAIDAGGKPLARSYGKIPFYRLSNNKQERNDLAPIKALIDDYDLMAAYLSNNLQDFTDAIYVVKGYPGDNLDTLKQNLKSRKAIGVSPDGDVEIKTIDIPVEARKTKLEIDKEAIYHFGMAFDPTQVGDGNITNIVIKSRYALLDMKCNKMEPRLRALIKWCNQLIVEDINRRNNTNYNADDITVTITRNTPVNENDLVANDKLAAETKQVTIQTILAVAAQLDSESLLRMICDEFELDYDEVQKRLDEQDYTPAIGTGTDPVEPTDEAGDSDEPTE